MTQGNQVAGWAPRTKPRLSAEQIEIMRWFRNGASGNFAVGAGAGCGKSFTMVLGGEVCPEKWVQYGAFNTRIKEHLEQTVKRGKAGTFHGIGLGALNWHKNGRSRDGVKIEVDKHVSYTRADEQVLQLKAKEDSPHQRDAELMAWLSDDADRCIVMMLERIKNCLPFIGKQGNDVFVRDAEAVAESITYYQELPMPQQGEGYEIAKRMLAGMCCRALNATIKNYLQTEGVGKEIFIDYNDMIWLPLRLNLIYPRWDILIVDEWQDLNRTQMYMMKKLFKNRLVVVGDRNQCIYTFRGADVKMMDEIIEELGMTVLPLMESRRCAKKIVQWAQQFVPEFRAHEDNPEGVVEELTDDDMLQAVMEGDAIISRTNAPLMEICLRLIAMGRRALIVGKEVGEALIKLLDKIEGKKRFTDKKDMLERVKLWAEKEKERIAEVVTNRGNSAFATQQQIAEEQEPVNIKVQIYKVMLDHHEPRKVRSELERLFKDPSRGEKEYVICTTIHKAKGLEWDRVFVLADTLKVSEDEDSEENRLCYVAGTRAKYELYLVGDGNPTDMTFAEACVIEHMEETVDEEIEEIKKEAVWAEVVMAADGVEPMELELDEMMDEELDEDLDELFVPAKASFATMFPHLARRAEEMKAQREGREVRKVVEKKTFSLPMTWGGDVDEERDEEEYDA